MIGILTKKAIYGLLDVWIIWIVWHNAHWSVALLLTIATIRWFFEDLIEALKNYAEAA